MSGIDRDQCTALLAWLRSERDVAPPVVVGTFSKQGVNIKAGHQWSYLRLDHQVKLWLGKDLIDQTIALRPMAIQGQRGVQLLHRPPSGGGTAHEPDRFVREFIMSQGQLRRMDEVWVDPVTRIGRHPYFPSQSIFIARYKALSAAQPFILTYDSAKRIIAARSFPRHYPTPIHPVLPALGAQPVAYILGGSLQHPSVNHLTGIILDVRVAKAGNIYRITAGESAEGRPRFHRVFRHAGPAGIAVELENGIPIAMYSEGVSPDPSCRRPLLVKRRWPNQLPQECAPSYLTARWLFMLPVLITGQVVKKEGVVWVQKRPLYVGRRFAGLEAETIAISSTQAAEVGTQATFHVTIRDQQGERVRSCGFTWQGQGLEPWSSEIVKRVEMIQPIAQRRVLDQALWLPLTTEMLAQGWAVSDVGELARCVTDLGLGRETWVTHYVQQALCELRGCCPTEGAAIERIKEGLLQRIADGSDPDAPSS